MIPVAGRERGLEFIWLAVEQALMGLYWAFLLPAGALVLYLCYRVLFHRERWYAKTCRHIIDALPDPVEYWREAGSMEELESFQLEVTDKAMTKDPYFRFLVLDTRSAIRSCEAAYDALYGEGRRRRVDPSVMRRMGKAWARAAEKAGTVSVKWRYRDINKIFAVEQWRSGTGSLEHFVDAMRGTRSDGAELLSWTADADAIRVRSRWRNDFPGCWVAIRCPEGTDPSEAGGKCLEIRTGSGTRPMRAVRRRLRLPGWLGLFGGRPGEIFVRTVPVMPADDYYCPSDLYCTYCGGEYHGEYQHDTGVSGEVPEGEVAPRPPVGGVPGGRKVPAPVPRPAAVAAVAADRPRVEAPGQVERKPVAPVQQGPGGPGQHGEKEEILDWRGRQRRIDYRKYDYT